MKIRRRARIAVIQALFEVDLVHHDPAQALQERLSEWPLPSSGQVFSIKLLQGILKQQSRLDAIIQQIAPEWPIDQIAPVDRNIIRLGAYEILMDDDTPPKVAINEAVELAKAFGGESSSRFVNGVLGTVYSDGQALLNRLDVDESVDCEVDITSDQHEP